MFKRIWTAAAAVLLAVAFAGCSAQKFEDLPAGYDKDKVTAAAQNVAALMSAGDYATISDTLVREDLKTQLSADVLKNAAEKVMPKAGAFASLGDAAVGGYKDPKTQEEYAVAVIPVKYENQTVTYTLFLNADLKIVGLYLK